ncbi:MAG: CobW family GTP-binding protein [Prolixibacteraceae bacterium]
MQKIPLYIISGFLGSGKTTFLKRIIKKYAGDVKLGIIQNEFAPANIDGTELKLSGENFNLLEINNGSVFCVCLLGNFVRSLEKFIAQYQPDILIIEASGLSDTTSITEVISAGSLSEKIFLASNWCIVDAVNFEKAGLMKQRVIHQLKMADVVLINKSDLIRKEETGKSILEEIKSINPFAKIKFTTYCDIDFEIGFEHTEKFYFDSSKPLPRPELHSMVIKSGRKLSEESLKNFLQEWAPKAYRIKGFVNLTNGESVAVQCTFDSIEISETAFRNQPTELIALSEIFTLREWNKSFKSYS